MPRQHVVVLSPEERDRLRRLLRRDATTALQQRRARILLAAETRAGYPAQTDVAVATAVGVDARTVARVRAEFARFGLERALTGRTRVFPPRSKLDSAQEAQLVMVACSSPPPGQARWTLRLLADRLVALEVIEAISHETVRQTLKKTASSRGGCGGG
jgi:Homeodomain-like domain